MVALVRVGENISHIHFLVRDRALQSCNCCRKIKLPLKTRMVVSGYHRVALNRTAGPENNGPVERVLHVKL